MRKKVVSCFLMLLTAGTVLSQDNADSSFIAAAKEYAITLHDTELRSQSALYNGRKYIPPEYEPESHPYFALDDWITGSVYYDGEYFGDVSLMYDLYKAALIAEHFPSGHAIQLVGDKVQYFEINGHHFEKIYNDSVGNSLPSTGLYDVLYPGTTKVVARRVKKRREEIRDMSLNIFYEEKNRYFVFKNGVFFSVRNKASLLKILADRRRALKRFAKEQKIKFSQNKELALITMAGYYDSLE